MDEREGHCHRPVLRGLRRLHRLRRQLARPLGSKEVTDYLFKEFESIYGGMWAFENDPIKMAQMMIDHIDKKRKALGIDKARERVLFDMAMRRDLE